MLMFEQLIFKARTEGVSTIGPDPFGRPSRIFRKADEKFFKTCTESVPFLFLSKDQYFIPGDDLTFADAPLDLPYRVCSFENLPNDNSSVSSFRVSTEDHTIDCISIVAIEVSPKQYVFFSLVSDNHQKDFHVQFVSNESIFHDLLVAIVRDCLKRLSREEVGFQKTKIRIRMGHGDKKVEHKIRKLVYVCPKSLAPKVNAIHREIDWSHAWQVRGHWRDIRGLGKDREGNYCIPGKTWVLPHIKGDLEKELIKKPYVVLKNSQASNS